MSESYGKMLLEARLLAGYTQKELAEKIKYSKAYIGTIENNRPHTVTGALPKPDVDFVDKAAAVLGMDVNEARLAAGYAPQNAADVPKPILEALAREGTLSPNDETLIADFITRLKQTQ